MTSEAAGQTTAVKTEEAAAASNPAAVKAESKGPLGDQHINEDDVEKAWKECLKESLWYRSVPLSLGSVAVTGGLIYSGVLKAAKHSNPIYSLAVAGILGHIVGQVSYFETCQSKLKNICLDYGPWSERSRPGHRYCHHVCEECKKTAQTAPAEEVKK